MKVIRILVSVTALLTTVLAVYYYVSIYSNRDLTGPNIYSRYDSITASIHDGSDVLTEGLSAIDEIDGDVTDSILIESISHIEKNKCSVVYAAADSSNNVTKFARNVEFTDYESPKFRITDRLRFPAGSGTKSILDCLEAYDCIDGDISGRIKIESDEPIDTSQIGIYDYNLSVTNSYGDTTVLPLSIEYYTDTYQERLYYPQIYLSEYLVYVKAGEEFLPKSYLDHLELSNNYYVFSSTGGNKEVNGSYKENFNTRTEDGTIIAGAIHLSAIRMDSTVDINTPGTYHVTFSCTTTDNYFGSVDMIVIVEE